MLPFIPNVTACQQTHMECSEMLTYRMALVVHLVRTYYVSIWEYTGKCFILKLFFPIYQSAFGTTVNQ